MEGIKETIEQVMRRIETSRKILDKNKPDAILKNIFSKKELEHVRVDSLKKGTLRLCVDSSAWLYQFNLQKEDLLKRFRSKPRAKIKDIRFYLGEMR